MDNKTYLEKAIEPDDLGKVLIHVTMSIDGFIAKPNEDDWDWISKYDSDDSDNMAEQILKELGAVVLGNKDFRNNKVTAKALPYGGVQMPHFVVTHNARQPLKIGTTTFQFVTGGVSQVIEIAKKAAGIKNVAILGHSIGQQGLELGLVDELSRSYLSCHFWERVKTYRPISLPTYRT